MGFNMSIAYWSQWDNEELSSMHGIEERDIEVYQDEIDVKTHQCSSCMYCLGLSWANFI